MHTLPEDIIGYCPKCGENIRPRNLYPDRRKMRAYNKSKRIVADHELDALIKQCTYYEEGTDMRVPGAEAYGLYWWPKIRSAVLWRDGYACTMCGSKDRLEVHHILYQNLGGSHHPFNLRTLCFSCHREKHREDHVTEEVDDRRQQKLEAF